MSLISEYPEEKSALAAVKANLAKGVFTLEFAEALELEDSVKLMDD
jgi:hypothetical protein